MILCVGLKAKGGLHKASGSYQQEGRMCHFSAEAGAFYFIAWELQAVYFRDTASKNKIYGSRIHL